MLIMGVDTALRCTGYGIIEAVGKSYRAVDCGVIRNTRTAPMTECLRRISGGMRQLVEQFSPDCAAIEGAFFFKNAKTAMILGMARGAALAELARSGITSYEYAPRKAKQVIVGRGNAGKEQVAQYIGQMLNLDVAEIPDDATDALSLAVCHILMIQNAGGVYLPRPL